MDKEYSVLRVICFDAFYLQRIRIIVKHSTKIQRIAKVAIKFTTLFIFDRFSDLK